MKNPTPTTNPKFEYTFSYTGKFLDFWKSLLFSVICALVTILSTSGLSDDSASTVFVIFIGILIIMFTVFLYGFWGVVTAFLSSLLFCLSKQIGVAESVINIGANTIQALCLYIVFKMTDIDESISDKGGIMTDYKFLLVAFGVMYILFSLMFDQMIVLYAFFGLIVALAIGFSVYEKSWLKIRFLLLVALIPSLFGGAINALSTVLVSFQWISILKSVTVWTLSNTILFTTFGYIILSVLGKLKKATPNALQTNVDSVQSVVGGKENKSYPLKLSTIMFYIATMVWNLLFYGMYLYGWLASNTVTYLFPWGVGNIFFLINLYFTLSPELDGENLEEAFKWFENRAVVAENNTQMIITIIAFLLPLSTSYLGTISLDIWFVFILNITAAVVSIGLIWVPRNNVRFMEFIKNLKTIFHLFTISLLLLTAIMIINGGVQNI